MFDEIEVSQAFSWMLSRLANQMPKRTNGEKRTGCVDWDDFDVEPDACIGVTPIRHESMRGKQATPMSTFFTSFRSGV